MRADVNRQVVLVDRPQGMVGVASGRIQYRTQVLEGLGSCADGLARLFQGDHLVRGDHLGKIVVRVSSS